MVIGQTGDALQGGFMDSSHPHHQRAAFGVLTSRVIGFGECGTSRGRVSRLIAKAESTPDCVACWGGRVKNLALLADLACRSHLFDLAQPQ